MTRVPTEMGRTLSGGVWKPASTGTNTKAKTNQTSFFIGLTY
jgi:hypothetical protein